MNVIIGARTNTPRLAPDGMIVSASCWCIPISGTVRAAPSLTAGKILASSALGRDDEWSGSGLNRGVTGRFPPEPIRYFGGFVVRAAVQRKEHREDVGRSVDPLTRRVAGLAPQGFFRAMR